MLSQSLLVLALLVSAVSCQNFPYSGQQQQQQQLQLQQQQQQRQQQQMGFNRLNLQSPLGMLGQSGMNLPRMGPGPQIPPSLANVPIGVALQLGLFGLNQCTSNETMVSCGTSCEPTCTTPTPPATCQQACVPNKCECFSGYLRSYDGTRCVLARDCASTLQNCQMMGSIRICYPGVLCGDTFCPSGWTCTRPQFCIGSFCQQQCVPDLGNNNPTLPY